LSWGGLSVGVRVGGISAVALGCGRGVACGGVGCWRVPGGRAWGGLRRRLVGRGRVVYTGYPVHGEAGAGGWVVVARDRCGVGVYMSWGVPGVGVVCVAGGVVVGWGGGWAGQPLCCLSWRRFGVGGLLGVGGVLWGGGAGGWYGGDGRGGGKQ